MPREPRGQSRSGIDRQPYTGPAPKRTLGEVTACLHCDGPLGGNIHCCPTCVEATYRAIAEAQAKGPGIAVKHSDIMRARAEMLAERGIVPSEPTPEPEPEPEPAPRTPVAAAPETPDFEFPAEIPAATPKPKPEPEPLTMNMFDL